LWELLLSCLISLLNEDFLWELLLSCLISLLNEDFLWELLLSCLISLLNEDFLWELLLSCLISLLNEDFLWELLLSCFIFISILSNLHMFSTYENHESYPLPTECSDFEREKASINTPFTAISNPRMNQHYVV
jgi:hypothetical protein